MTYNPIVSRLERLSRTFDEELARGRRDSDVLEAVRRETVEQITREQELIRQAVGRAMSVLSREGVALPTRTAQEDSPDYASTYELSETRARVELLAVEVERAALAGGFRKRRILQAAAEQLADERATAEALARAVQELTETVGRERREASLAQQREALALLRARELPDAVGALDRMSPPWDDPRWVGYDPESTQSDVARLGTLERVTPVGPVTIPVAVELPLPRGYTIESGHKHGTATSAGMTTLAVRLLTSHLAGRLKLLLIDPVSLGSSFGPLLHASDELYGGKVWTDPRHIEEQLSALTAHIERVTQRCLRSEYDNISDYNRAAGELAEPCYLVLIADFPTNFTANAGLALQRICEQGPRCGVTPVVHHSPELETPFGLDPATVIAATTRIRQTDGGLELGERPGWRFRFESLPADASPLGTSPGVLLGRLSGAIKTLDSVKVPFARVTEQASQKSRGSAVGALRVADSDSWWFGDSTDELAIAIGRVGADEICTLRLNDRTPHALVVGRTGMGKSNLFNVVITGLSLTYSPDHVEFYLIDFREGVTQSDFADHGLPHARVLALETVREFGLSVLRGLRQEMADRGAEYRKLNADQYPLYRRVGGRRPRIVLVVDEFHALFSPADDVADEAVRLLADLVQQGRGFGIHVILASQDLSRTHTFSQFDQLQTRIVFACDDRNARSALRHDNDAAAHLTRPGEAIFNDIAGLVAGNRKIQVSALERAELRLHLEDLRARADLEGRSRRPRVFEGGRRASLEEAVLPTPEGTMPTAWLGEPAALAPPVEISFRQQAGNNLLIVARDPINRRSALLTTVLGLRRARAEAAFTVIDCSAPGDDWITQPLAELLLASGIDVLRPTSLTAALEDVSNTVTGRLGGEPEECPIFLVIDDLKGARDLDAEAAPWADTGDPASANTRLASIVADGPTVRVWTIATADTLRSFERRIPPDAHRDFAWRLLHPMSLSDSLALLNSDEAARLREGHALLVNTDEGETTTLLPYTLPSSEYLRKALEG